MQAVTSGAQSMATFVGVEDPGLFVGYQRPQGSASVKREGGPRFGTGAKAFPDQFRRGCVFLRDWLAARPTEISMQRPTCRWKGGRKPT